MKIKKVTIIHSGGEPDYLSGLVKALARNNHYQFDIIDSDQTEMLFKNLKNVRHYNYKGIIGKSLNVTDLLLKGIKYYFKLLSYTLRTDSKIYHIQWLSRNEKFERIIIIPLIVLLGKKIIYTAHNINRNQRDNNDSYFNRITLKIFYRITDHIIVHNEVMKEILYQEYSVPLHKIKVISHGLNIAVPKRGLTQQQAREILNIDKGKKVLLFFGNLAHYKGLDLLVSAFKALLVEDKDYQLIIAGKGKRDEVEFTQKIILSVNELSSEKILSRIEFIPDIEIESYFIAADCIVLPYRNIFESGVLFLALRFGLPAILSNIGNFKETIIQDKTGFVFQAENIMDLKNTIIKYFQSQMYQNLEQTRQFIIRFGEENYSWDKIAEKTIEIYELNSK